tara:strand:- start:9992 stop:10987 length:996 start_codon:yes stop_codon:yes gene_type:complete
LIYQVASSAQEPNIRDARQPAGYRVPVSAQEPNIRDARSPRAYQNPVSAQEPNIRDARSPRAYQNPSNAQQPNIRDARSPRAYQNPVSAQQPTIKNNQQPTIKNGQQPNIANAREPNIRNAQEPNIRNAQSNVNSQQPYTFPTTGNLQTPVNLPGGPSGGPGCFAPGTMIWLADGSHAPIEHCMLGQIVMTWNENTKLLEPKPISLIMQPRPDNIYDVELSDGRILQVTDSHPIMLANGEWGAFDVEKCNREHDWMQGVNSHEIKVGDNLFSMTDAIMFDRKDKVGLEVVSIDENQEMTVHNLSGIEENHNFFANGMLVHNFQEAGPGIKP